MDDSSTTKRRARKPDKRVRPERSPDVIARLPPAEREGWTRLVEVFGVKTLVTRLALLRLDRELQTAKAAGQDPADVFAEDLAAMETALRSA